MADLLAEHASFLSSDPDALAVFAKWFGKFKEEVASAEMTGITTKVCVYSEIS